MCKSADEKNLDNLFHFLSMYCDFLLIVCSSPMHFMKSVCILPVLADFIFTFSFLFNIAPSHPLTPLPLSLFRSLYSHLISSLSITLCRQFLSPRSVFSFFLSIFLLSILICNFPLARDSGCKMEQLVGSEGHNLWLTLTLARTKDVRVIFHLLLLSFSFPFYATFCLCCYSSQSHRGTIMHYGERSTFWHARLGISLHGTCTYLHAS